MKKLNEKGVTLIELIVSFALVATAVIYFYQTLSTVYDLYVTSKKETQEYVDKDYAMRIVDAYVNENIGKAGFDVNEICNYIGCSSVTFEGGDINIVEIKKEYNNEEYVWLTYYTPKKDQVGEKIENLLVHNKLSDNTMKEICSSSGMGADCTYTYDDSPSINKDTIYIKNSENKTLYTYEKIYDLDEVAIADEITEYINGTKSNISDYCVGKNWCDDVFGDNIDSGIILKRNENPIATISYSIIDTINIKEDKINIQIDNNKYERIKTYQVNENVEKTNLTNYLKKNGTIDLTNYCNDKKWCSGISYNTPTNINEKFKITVKRNEKSLFTNEYNGSDTAGEVVVDRINSNGAGIFYAYYPGFETSMAKLTPKFNVIGSSFGETKTSYTFSKEYSGIKGLKIYYYTGTDGNYTGITEFLLVDENGNEIVSSGLFGLPTTSVDSKYTWGPESGGTWYAEIVSSNIINKTVRLKVIVEHYGESTVGHSVYAAIHSIYPIKD